MNSFGELLVFVWIFFTSLPFTLLYKTEYCWYGVGINFIYILAIYTIVRKYLGEISSMIILVVMLVTFFILVLAWISNIGVK